jgi:Kdo2-lipid IVA lauroyltransferase/acyltransferase
MHSLTSFFTKLLIKLFALVPFWLLWPLSDLLAFVLCNLFGYRKKIILSNLQNSFPEKTEAEIQVLIKQFYRHFADLLLESIKGLTLSKQELQRRFVYLNPEIFQPLFEKNKSAILLGSHFSNWEWGVLSFPLSVQHTVVGVYKPLKNKILDKYLTSLRKQWGLHLTDMTHTGKAVVQYKNQPTIFVLIADQTPSDIRNAHWVRFLNQQTPFLHGMDKLARQTGYPVYYFEIERVRRGFYEVSFTHISEAKEDLAEGEITRRFAKRLEATIHRSPADWLWSHRRWKRADQFGKTVLQPTQH